MTKGTRSRRVITMLAALSMLVGLLVITSGPAVGKPTGGNNNAAAKQCKDWADLYRTDGTTFVDKGACTSYAAEGGVILTEPPVPPLPNQVVVNAPSPAAGTYEASGADFGPSLSSSGVAGTLVLVNDGTASPTTGCFPLVGFPAGAIAILDRGVCDFDLKAVNAQNAGAVAVIVVNNVAGDPFTMTGSSFTVTIPAVMVAQEDGAVIKAGLPAAGSVTAAP